MKVTAITVSVSRKLDLGYKPFMKDIRPWLEQVGGIPFGRKDVARQIPFGIRDNSTVEQFISAKIELEETESENWLSIGESAAEELDGILVKLMGAQYINQFDNPVLPEDGEFVSATSFVAPGSDTW